MSQPKIYLSTWAIKKSIENGELIAHDAVALAREHGFSGVEIIDRHLPDLSSETVQRLKKEIVRNNLACTLGITTDFVSTSEDSLAAQIKYTIKMIEIGDFLGAVSLRILLGGTDFFFQNWLKPKDKIQSDSISLTNIKKQKKLTNWLQKVGIFHILHKLTIQAKRPRSIISDKVRQSVFSALDQIVPLAEKKKIPLAVENHWGITTATENIIFFINHCSTEFLGTCVDLGNFSLWQNRYQEMQKLLPWAKEIHAKTYAFDGCGEEKNIDYSRTMQLIRESGKLVPIVVEYEGRGDQLQNSLKTRDLILKHWNEI